jgi:hypothetical protein
MFLVLLASLPAARSMPWPGPSQTAQSSGAKDGVQVPTPTDGPKNELVVQAARRDITVAPNTCGWVNGDSGCKWTLQICGQEWKTFSGRKMQNAKRL